MDRHGNDFEDSRRRSAGQLLREFGGLARIVVYLSAGPGAGKTRRLLTDARRLQLAGKNVAIGWIDAKGRPDLENLAQDFPRIPARTATLGSTSYPEFDVAAAIAMKPDVLLLDELAHDNLPGSPNGKRWQDALALRSAGISVITACNIANVETAAPVAETLVGYPVREIVPIAFLRSADEVVALDASPELLRRRLYGGKIVGDADISTAGAGPFKEQTLIFLRELLLRTIDDLTISTVSPAHASVAVAILPGDAHARSFVQRSASIAAALDLALEIAPLRDSERDATERLARENDAELLSPVDPKHFDLSSIRASLVAVPHGALAEKLVSARVDRDIFVADATQSYLERSLRSTPLSDTLGDRMRVGYGKLTVYLGAAAGSGKTFAMLDRGNQLLADGVDVAIGLVETHGRAETQAMIGNLEIVPRKTIASNGIQYSELDRDAVLARKPQIALVDELAHTNAPGSLASKRYLDVLAFLRAGIDVITTLNVQHLEALSDAVFRLTGTTVRETLPDGILPLADEVILIDVAPETLRARLREGKIYPQQRIEPALANFFRSDNLTALRELAIREALRAETRARIAAPFERLQLSIVARPDDLPLVRKASRLAARLEIDFTLCHVARPRDAVDANSLEQFARAARAINAEWVDERAEDPPARILEIARARRETAVAVGGTRRNPRLLQRRSFARRMLDAGARELIVLARPPEAPDQASEDLGT